MAADPRKRSFLGGLSDAEAQALLAQGRRRRFPRGAALFLEGDTSGHVVVLTAGRVKVSYLTERGHDIVLAVREPGDLLGELSVIDGHPRSATAVAIEPVEAVLVEGDRFRGFLRERPDVTIALLRLVAERLRDSDRKRVEFGAVDTLGRVAGRLVELAERFGRPGADGTRVDLPLTQEDLAAWVGASRKAVTNALHALRDRGWIATGRKNVVVHDLDALRRRAT